MTLEPLFKGNDLRLIEALEFNGALEPSYDLIKSCLVWKDEEASGLTPEGYEALCDLWVARSFIHRGRDFASYPIDPEYFANIWKRALSQGFRWPGFERLALSEKDRQYYENAMKQNSNF